MFENEKSQSTVIAPTPVSEPPGSEIDSEIPKRRDVFGQAPRPEWAMESTGFHRGPMSRSRGYIVAAWSFIAAMIDFLLLLSISCLFFATFAMIMKSSLQDVLQFFETSVPFLLVGFLLILSAFYLVLLRSFLGFTVGEWACGLRLGLPKQRLGRNYSLKVIARTFVIFASGVVTLPVLSLLVGKDLPGRLLNLSLTQKAMPAGSQTSGKRS